MSLQKHSFWFLVVIAAILAGIWAWWTKPWVPAYSDLADGAVVEAELGEQPITIEVVKTPQSITQGLSDRSSIGSDGMLFILDRTQFPSFWMRRMLFDLDLIWLLDNQVVEITRQVPHPAPGTPESELPLYRPSVPVNQVLEVPAGTAEALGITVGDQLEIK